MSLGTKELINRCIDMGWINHDKVKQNVPCFLHDEQNGSALYFNFDTNFYKCYGKCGIKGKITDLLINEGIFVTFIADLESNNIIEDKPAEKQLLEVQHNKVIERYNKYNKNIDYLNKRELDQHIYSENYVSYCSFNSRVYIPIYYLDKCYGYIKRTTFDDSYIKYLKKKYLSEDASNMQLERYLLNSNDEYDNLLVLRYNILTKYLNDSTLLKNKLIYQPLTNKSIVNPKYLIIVEGAFDAMKVNQFGQCAVAILGEGINTEQVDMIYDYADKLGVKEIISGFDGDIAGNKFHSKLCDIDKRMFKRIDYSLVKAKDMMDVKNCNDFEYLLDNISYMLYN